MRKLLREKNRYIEVFLGIIFFFIVYMVVYKMVAYVDSMNSDYRAHVLFAETLKDFSLDYFSEFMSTVVYAHIISYPGWHILYLLVLEVVNVLGGTLQEVTQRAISAGVVTGLFGVTTYGLLVYYIRKNYSGNRDVLIGILSIYLLIMGPLDCPIFTNQYYLGQFMPNTWHNPTTIAVKPIALVCFFLYGEILNSQTKVSGKKYGLAALLLFLSAFLKPSFYQMFVPGLFLYCVYELLFSKGKFLRKGIIIGFSVLPVTLLALIQMKLSFGGADDGIGVDFLYVWKEFAPYPLISLIISIPFILLVFIANVKTNKQNKEIGLAIFTLVSAIGQFAFLYKKNAPMAGDFSWGCYLAVFVANVVALISALKREDLLLKNKWYYSCVWLVFGMQVVYGVLYLLRIYFLGTYS